MFTTGDIEDHQEPGNPEIPAARRLIECLRSYRPSR
jgi:hypothetical protein